LKTIRSAQEKGFQLTKPNGIAPSGSKPGCKPAPFVFPLLAAPACVRLRGFTLLEMVIVIGLVAILGAFALPAYNDFVVRTKLRSGTEGLIAFRSVLEQSYQDARSYRTDDDSACRVASIPSEYFTLNCAATSDTLYTLSATSAAGQGLGDAGDYVYTINQDGVVSTTSFRGESTTADHWVYQ
jgi:type IV pilus assembly protein PilE